MASLLSVKQTYSAQEVASILGVSVSTIYKMERSGNLPAFRIGDRVIFSLSVLAAKWPEVFGDDHRAA